jgi:hypothetical protein
MPQSARIYSRTLYDAIELAARAHSGQVRKGLAEEGDAYWRRFNRPGADQAWYYPELARVFTARMTAEPGVSLAARFASEAAAVFPASSA